MSRPVGGWLVVVGLSVLASACTGGGGGGGSSNNAPVAVDDVATTSEDVPVALDVLLNDTDEDADDLVFVVGFTEATSGTVLIDADGTVIYEPDPDFSGSDSFTYTISDGRETATATVAVTVSTVGDAPVAVADAYDATEDAVLTVAVALGVLANDDDVDTTGFTAVIDQDAGDGTVALAADGSFTYTPDADFSGADAFTYHATDGTQSSSIVTVSIAVAAVNDAPVADADGAYTVDEDGVLTVNAATGVLDGDTDADGDDLDALAATQPANGSLALAADGSFTYTPNADFNGSDSFTYSARDGVASSAPATVTLTITAVNDAPVAAADAYAGTEDTTLTQAAPGVLANDTDVDAGATLTAVLVAGPSSASSFTLNADGSFDYTPNANFNGSDSFTYQANDGTANSGITTVTLSIGAVNDPPVADDDNYSTDEDTVLVVNVVTGVLDGDTDVDGDTLDALLTGAAANGTVALAADGSFTYTPNANFNGSDSFTYVARDGVASSSTATVSITVNALNDAPLAVADSYSTAEDAALSVSTPGVLANDSDAESAITASLVAGPTNAASFTLNADGSFDYTPDPDFNGSDSFTYSADDGTANGNTVTVSLAISAENDAPSFVSGGDVTVSEDSGSYSAGWATGISAGAADEGSQALTFEVLAGDPSDFAQQPAIASDGTLTFAPAANFFGTAPVSVALADDAGGRSAAVVFHVEVTGVNDAPSIIVGGDRAVSEDSTTYLEANFATNLAGPGGESELFNVFTGVENGSLFSNNCSQPNCGFPNVALDGTLTFELAPDAHGSTVVNLSIIDQFGLVNGGSFTLTVNPVNDPPTFTVGADQPVLDDGLPRTVPGFVTGMSAGPNESDSWTFSVLNDDPTAFDVAPAIAPDGTLTYTPAVGAAPATVLVSVTMNDTGTPSASAGPQTFQIFISDPLQPPGLVSSTPADGDILSLQEAVEQTPMVVVFDDPDLDCDGVVVDVTGSESGPIGFSKQCVTPGQIELTFTPFFTDQDGETIQVDLTNIFDDLANQGPDETILFGFDSQSPTPSFLDDISSIGCRAANTRLIAQFNESMDDASTAAFDLMPSATPVTAETNGGLGFASLDFADDTFYLVPRDLLEGGGGYQIDVSSLTDVAGNPSTFGAANFGVCGGGPGGPGDGVVLDKLEFRNNGSLISTTEDTEIVDGFTLVSSLNYDSDNDLDLYFSSPIDPGGTAQLYQEDENDGGGTSVDASVVAGNLHFDIANAPGFVWQPNVHYRVSYNVCSGASCTGNGFSFYVRNPADGTNPLATAITGFRANGASPILRPEEPFTIGFSERVDRRTVVPSSFELRNSANELVPVVIIEENGGGGVDGEKVTLRADAGDGTPGPLPADIYSLLVKSTILDHSDPGNPLIAAGFVLQVAPLGFGTSFSTIYPSPSAVGVDPQAGAIFLEFSDAMSRHSFIDTGDPSVTPRGFRLRERFVGTFGSAEIPLKGLSTRQESNGPGGNANSAAEPETIRLGFPGCCGAELNGFTEGREYLVMVFAEAKNADGDELGVDSTEFPFSMTDDGDDVTPTFTQFNTNMEFFPPGALLYGGQPLTTQARVTVRFEDNDVFDNGNNELVSLTVIGEPDSGSGELSTSPQQTLEFQEFELNDPLVVDSMFNPSEVTTLTFLLEDSAGNSAVARETHRSLSGPPPAPTVNPISGQEIQFTGTISAADSPFVDTVTIGILSVDGSGPTPNVLDVVYAFVAQVSRDSGTGAITYDYTGFVNLPDIAPFEYRALAIANVPAMISTGQSSASWFSDPTAVIASNVPATFPPVEPFFTEYIEGSSNNKAVEVYNPGFQTLDLTQCSVRIYSNGSFTPSTTIALTGTLAPGDVHVLCDDNSAAGILGVCDQQSPSAFYNGDDGVELFCFGGTSDFLGQAGFDPGTEWGVSLTSTADNTLVRRCQVGTGEPDQLDPFIPASEWVGFATDDFTHLGIADCVP